MGGWVSGSMVYLNSTLPTYAVNEHNWLGSTYGNCSTVIFLFCSSMINRLGSSVVLSFS